MFGLDECDDVDTRVARAVEPRGEFGWRGCAARRRRERRDADERGTRGRGW